MAIKKNTKFKATKKKEPWYAITETMSKEEADYRWEAIVKPLMERANQLCEELQEENGKSISNI